MNRSVKKRGKTVTHKPGTILEALYDRAVHLAEGKVVSDLRIGLGYVGARTGDHSMGLAALLFDSISPGCTVLRSAGSHAGSSATSLLTYLVEGKNPMERAMGLATANALIDPPREAIDDREATSYLDFRAGERVVMIGLFSPLVERIRSTGASLTIIEKNPERMEMMNEDEQQNALRHCDVAVITATTLLNHTFEEIIHRLGKPRCTAVIGPSTPLLPEIFHDTPVTHLGGAVVTEPDRVMRIISEAGGTPAMRTALRFVNLTIKRNRPEYRS
jgi:uncharacterized protein (DUF4213/DUF364 family)